jgi:ribonuclease HI
MGFCEWLSQSIITEKQDTISLVAAIIYNMWSARNNLVFNQKSILVAKIIQNAVEDVSNYRINTSTNRSMSETGMISRNTGWSPPAIPSLKLNVDAHSLSDGRWGLGFILRRSDGSPVVVRTSVIVSFEEAVLAEALGIQEALKWIKNNNLANIIVESDAKIVVEAIQGNRSENRRYWGLVVAHCKAQPKELDRISVRWVRRIGNVVAHNIARWARFEPDKEWAHNFPCNIANHIQKDMVNCPLSYKFSLFIPKKKKLSK